jgi:hypothetical protein
LDDCFTQYFVFEVFGFGGRLQVGEVFLGEAGLELVVGAGFEEVVGAEVDGGGWEDGPVVTVFEAFLGENGAPMLICKAYETGNLRQIFQRDESMVLDLGWWLVHTWLLDADALFRGH